MKKQLLLLAVFFLTTITSFAITYTVHVGAMSFTPAALTVNPGDIVKWVWDNGNHTTSSSLVPSGAADWDKPINSTDQTYSYTFTILGTYNYQCTFHKTMGMLGTIYVVMPVNVAQVNADPLFRIFPNPVSDIVHLQFIQPLIPSSVSLTDMTGKEIQNIHNNGITETTLNLNNIPNGSYIINAQQGEKVYQQKIVVAH